MLVSAALCLSFLPSPHAAPETLAEYLRAHPIANVVSVAPEATLREKEGADLAAFGRRAVRIGGVNAVVPIRVVAFDDALAQPPNPYDGLPREAKALYLLAVLTSDQRRTAAGRGLCLDDLQGEPRAVLASLLPKKLGWRKGRAGDGTRRTEILGSGTIEGDDLRRVRLQYVQAVHFNFALSGDPNATSGITTTSVRRQSGQLWAERDERADEERQGDALFGVQLRWTAENRPKKGALDTRRLDGTATLRAGGTVGEALAAIGAKSGLELLADFRVRDLRVVTGGGASRAGDLLDALALAVGGTYRRVGGAYLLTSDVLGAGVRQARLKAWEEGVRVSLMRKEKEWRKALRKERGLRDVGFASDDPYAANEAMAPYLDHAASTDERFPVAASMLPPGLQAFLRDHAESGGDRYRLDRVAVDRSYTFRFVLPDGTPLAAETAGIGLGSQFRDEPREEDEALPPRSPVALAAQGPALPAMFRTDVSVEAEKGVAEARAHGIREVWLETRNAAALAAALKGGVAVRLVVRPWGAPKATPAGDLDRTPMGEDGATLAARIAKDPLWLDGEGKPYRSGSPLRDVVQPDSASWARATSEIVALARTPGLAGVALIDTLPHGYEGRRTDGISPSYPAPFAALTAFGSTEGARLAFLRKHGVDPIDLGWASLVGTIDAQPSFFPDRNLRNWASDGRPSTEPPALGGALAAWDRALADANVAAVRGLLARLSGIPVEIEARPGQFNVPSWGVPSLYRYEGNGKLPVHFSEGEAPQEGRLRLTVEPDGSAIYLPYVLDRKVKEGAGGGPMPVLDLSELPPAAWARTLDRLLMRREG